MSKTIESINYKTVTDMAKYFEITANALNIIFTNLNWAYKEERWWLATELGVKKGAKECYNTKNKVKYLQWNESIKEDVELLDAIQNFQERAKKKVVVTKVEALTPKEKGDQYEAFIAEHYKKMGCFVWEHGKEKGRKDKGIDLIVKDKEEIIFIQCKNWKENTRFKIDHKEVKATRMEASDFIKENPIFQTYKNKIRYTLSGDFIHASAVKYIEEHSEILDYEVVRMEE